MTFTTKAATHAADFPAPVGHDPLFQVRAGIPAGKVTGHCQMALLFSLDLLSEVLTDVEGNEFASAKVFAARALIEQAIAGYDAIDTHT